MRKRRNETRKSVDDILMEIGVDQTKFMGSIGEERIGFDRDQWVKYTCLTCQSGRCSMFVFLREVYQKVKL